MLSSKSLILPHIKIGLDEDNCVAVNVEDYELFDFIDDYITEDCDMDWKDRSDSISEGREVYTMHFNSKYSIEEVETVLLKLSPVEIEKIYALNN